MAFKKGETGNPDGRPRGAKNKRTLIRDALKKVYPDGESGFWVAVAKRALEGDTTSVSMLGARLIPPLKAEDTSVILAGLNSGNLTEKANKIIGYMGSGDISPSQATTMINAIATLCKVQEIEDLSKRLDALERILRDRK